jgi:hypothetical protein
LGKAKQAIADCTKAIELRPNYQSAYQTRLLAYNKLNMAKEAQADSRKIAELKKEESKRENESAGTWRVVSGGVSKASLNSTYNPYNGMSGRYISVGGSSGGC